MVYFISPYGLDRDYGAACNKSMQLLPFDTDWACITDLDVCFLHSDTPKQICEIIEMLPDTGMFTCLTNRVGNIDQCYNGGISDNFDFRYHSLIAEKLIKEKRHDTSWVYKVISGHMMVVKKSTWKEVGGFKNGILGVDNDFSKKILSNGHNILLMEGVYVFHGYRVIGGVKDKSHLIK